MGALPICAGAQLTILQSTFAHLTAGRKTGAFVSELTGKGAVVTGGGRGIGLACARLIAERGGSVALLGEDPEMLEQAVTTLRAEKLNVTAIVVDVGIEDDIATAMEQAVEFLGSIDILINNAAIQPYGTVVSMGSVEWDNVIRINLRGTYLACHYALPYMLKKQRGSIISRTSGMTSCAKRFISASNG